uniref:Steroid delta-isomerase n=2 Tax=Candidatus Bipolaricaulota TaxID=67810 RepID=H5SMJ6_9BACT|nr:steroid delta-isomerase [uncultured Acetothermia bacterium]BAL58898.1 steroid delta-isomerase [Candidatus Acetothermum autotrophicum]
MKRLYTLFVAAAMGLLLVSCVQLMGPEATPETVRHAIENAAANFAEAFNQGDATAVAAFYWEDAQVLPPNAEMVSGRPAIQEFWQGFIETTVWRELTLEPLKVEHEGPLAYEVGVYALRFQAQGGTQVATDMGKYIVVWKRQSDRSWRIVADIWNSSAPLAVP